MEISLFLLLCNIWDCLALSVVLALNLRRCPLSIQITRFLSPVDKEITELPAAVKTPKHSSGSPIRGLHSDMHGR